MEISHPFVTSEFIFKMFCFQLNPPSVSITSGRDSLSPLLTLKAKEQDVAPGTQVHSELKHSEIVAPLKLSPLQ